MRSSMSDSAACVSGPAGSLCVADQTLPSETTIAASEQLTEVFLLLFHVINRNRTNNLPAEIWIVA